MDSDRDFEFVLSASRDKRKPLTHFPKLTMFSNTSTDGFKRSKENTGKSYKTCLLVIAIITIMAIISYQIIFK